MLAEWWILYEHAGQEMKYKAHCPIKRLLTTIWKSFFMLNIRPLGIFDTQFDKKSMLIESVQTRNINTG